MSGRVLRILGRTDYDYTTLSATAATGEIPIAVDVDVSGSRETTLLVRTHSHNLLTGTAGAKYELVVRASAPTTEEPNVAFRDATPLVVATTIASYTGGTAAPYLTRLVIPANAGAWITVFMKVTQGSSGNSALKGSFSIDASLKD